MVCMSASRKAQISNCIPALNFRVQGLDQERYFGGHPMTQSKYSLRQRINQKRKILSPSDLKQREQQLFLQLIQIPELIKAQTIAAYCPHGGEISPLKALRHWQKQGKTIALPRMRDQRQMRFHPFFPNSQLIRNRFGILEPRSRQFTAPQQLDIVLLPLVGFDCLGNRLGMGGGYYDRALAFMQRQPWRRKPLLIGLAHDFQELNFIPTEAWDIPLSLIVTNKRCYRLL